MLNTTSAKIRILLVEGQPLVQQALASLMAGTEGVQVVGSTNTLAEGIRAAATLQPDLVLLSIAGEWGAFSAVEKIKMACPTAKVILLDERSLEANAREALRVQAAGYLTKEQPDHQIENALRRAARGERVFAPDIAARLVLSADGVRLARDTQASPLSSLTPREIDVLVHLAQGFSVKQCAKALGIGTSTAGNHKSRLMKKLDVHKTVDLTRLAIREGLVPEGRGRIGAPHIQNFEEARHETA
ncbi:MAG: LuxR C-terminal-related transcriptional regulator [Pirellulales bacterium]